MLHKMRDSQGLTMVEMLCATIILMLLALMLNSGLQMAMNSYRRMVLRSEADLLLATLSDVLTDELRYARNVTTKTSGTDIILDNYDSWLYGEDTVLTVDDGSDNKGQIKAGTFFVLPDASYGGGTWKYGVPSDGMKITYDSDKQTFTVSLTVQEMQPQPDGTVTFSGITAESGDFKVHCLNK